MQAVQISLWRNAQSDDCMSVFVILLNCCDCPNVIFMFLEVEKTKYVLNHFSSMEIQACHLYFKLCSVWWLVLFAMFSFTCIWEVSAREQVLWNLLCDIFIIFGEYFLSYLIWPRFSSKLQKGAEEPRVWSDSGKVGVVMLSSSTKANRGHFIHSEMSRGLRKPTRKWALENERVPARWGWVGWNRKNHFI